MYLTHPCHLPQKLPVPNIPMAAVMFGAISDLKDDIKYFFCETLLFSCMKIWYWKHQVNIFAWKKVFKNFDLAQQKEIYNYRHLFTFIFFFVFFYKQT